MQDTKKLFLTLLFALFSFNVSAFDGVVREIVVENNKRIEKATILSYIDIKVGEEYNASKINSSLKKLYSTGLFSDITSTRKGNKIIITVAENPIIKDIVFEGNKRVDDKTLSSETSLLPRSVYTKAKLQSDLRRIKDVYRQNGRFAVDIDPKVVQLDQNRINLIFEIDEGAKSTVRKVLFVGNEIFSDKKLAKVINTHPWVWYRFFSSADKYDPDRVAFDRELLRKFYVSRGYADFQVLSTAAEITKDQKSFVITFRVEEGKKYNFGTIDVRSKLPDISADDINEYVETKPGKTFNADLVEDTVLNITNKLNDLGYAFVDVQTQFKRDTEKQLMDILYNVKEGPKVYINRINISGNVRTEDRVIRREMRLAEGDPYNAAQIRRSSQRIRNLGFFENVELNNKKVAEKDKVDIDINIKEQSTGELNFGAGFSTNEGPLGNVSVRERNLLGKGQDIRLSFQQSGRGQQIDLSFTEPYFLGRDISAGFDVFNIVRDFESESSFDSETKGFTLRGSYSLTEHLRHTLRYSLKTVDITDIQSDASIFIQQQAGENTTSLVGHTFLYDRRNNRFDPTNGYFVRINQDFAGLGGNDRFIRHEVRGSYYKPIYKEDVIFSQSFRGGHVVGVGSQDVRINERFFVGSNSIRGFKNSGIGPRDDVTRDALGGNIFYVTSTEVTFPLGLPSELGFKGSTFVDTGTLFDVDDTGSNVLDESSIRLSVGFGVSWSSPLGPIRIDFASPLIKESFDRTENVRFSFGTRF